MEIAIQFFCDSEINGNQLEFDIFVIMLISNFQSRIDGAPAKARILLVSSIIL
jgi:hypothetical protein